MKGEGLAVDTTIFGRTTGSLFEMNRLSMAQTLKDFKLTHHLLPQVVDFAP